MIDGESMITERAKVAAYSNITRISKTRVSPNLDGRLKAPVISICLSIPRSNRALIPEVGLSNGITHHYIFEGATRSVEFYNSKSLHIPARKTASTRITFNINKKSDFPSWLETKVE